MAKRSWFQVTPGRHVLIDFSDGNAKVLPAGSVFEEFASNASIERLLRAPGNRVRQIDADEASLILGRDVRPVVEKQPAEPEKPKPKAKRGRKPKNAD